MKLSERELLAKAEQLTKLVRQMDGDGPDGHDIDEAARGLLLAKFLADALDFENEDPERGEEAVDDVLARYSRRRARPRDGGAMISDERRARIREMRLGLTPHSLADDAITLARSGTTPGEISPGEISPGERVLVFRRRGLRIEIARGAHPETIAALAQLQSSLQRLLTQWGQTYTTLADDVGFEIVGDEPPNPEKR